MESNADVILRAAELMRKRAKKATEGPWQASLVRSPRSHATSGVYSYAHPAGSTESEVAASGRRGKGCGGITDPDNAEHIASWHPIVAVEVADFLESCGKDLAMSGRLSSCDEPGSIERAYDIACAYLAAGGPS